MALEGTLPLLTPFGIICEVARPLQSAHQFSCFFPHLVPARWFSSHTAPDLIVQHGGLGGELLMFALLRERNVFLLWTAHTISILGDYVFFIAITFWIYAQTGSAF